MLWEEPYRPRSEAFRFAANRPFGRRSRFCAEQMSVLPSGAVTCYPVTWTVNMVERSWLLQMKFSSRLTGWQYDVLKRDKIFRYLKTRLMFSVAPISLQPLKAFAGLLFLLTVKIFNISSQIVGASLKSLVGWGKEAEAFCLFMSLTFWPFGGILRPAT